VTNYYNPPDDITQFEDNVNAGSSQNRNDSPNAGNGHRADGSSPNGSSSALAAPVGAARQRGGGLDAETGALMRYGNETRGAQSGDDELPPYQDDFEDEGVGMGAFVGPQLPSHDAHFTHNNWSWPSNNQSLEDDGFGDDDVKSDAANEADSDDATARIVEDFADDDENLNHLAQDSPYRAYGHEYEEDIELEGSRFRNTIYTHSGGMHAGMPSPSSDSHNQVTGSGDEDVIQSKEVDIEMSDVGNGHMDDGNVVDIALDEPTNGDSGPDAGHSIKTDKVS
jgi:hypothetical protein